MASKNIDYWEDLLKSAPKEYLSLLKVERKFLKDNVKPASNVLEVGCGNGRSLKYLATISDNLVGIDHDGMAIEHAKNNLKDYKKIKLIKSEGVSIPFSDKIFDRSLCLMTFSNLAKDKLAVLNDMRRVTKPDGYLLISCYNEDSLPVRLQIYKKLNIPIRKINDNSTVIFDSSLGDNISEQFTKPQLENIFSEAGLKIKSIEKRGIGYFCVLNF